MRFLIGLWPQDGFPGHTDLVPFWVRLADLLSSWVNFQMEAMSYDPQTKDSYWYKVDSSMWGLIVVP